MPAVSQLKRTGARCALCGLTAGNSASVPVHRYALRRSVYPHGWKVGDIAYRVTLASIALCDRCIRDVGEEPRPTGLRSKRTATMQPAFARR